jgi:hypothetical protein
MSQEKRHGSAQGWTPGGKVQPKKKAKPITKAPGPKGKGQPNEGEPRWSGDPKRGP